MVSQEKADNIRALFRDGMSKQAISRKLKMQWETVDRICAGVADPHEGKAQQLFTSLYWRQRRGGKALPREFVLNDTDW